MVGYIENLIQFLTKFSIIYMAITGAPFCKAGKKTTNILIKHSLSAISVDMFTEIVLYINTSIISVIIGITTYTYCDYSSYGYNNAIVLSSIVGIGCLIILSFISGIILNAVDTTFICYAIDIENNGYHNLNKNIHTTFNKIKKGQDITGSRTNLLTNI